MTILRSLVRFSNLVKATRKPGYGLYSTEPNPALSSKFDYTFDNGTLDDAQRKFYEDNGFIVIRRLVANDKLEKYKQRFCDIANGKVKVPGIVAQKDVSFVDQPRNENTVYKLQDLFLDEQLFAYCEHEKILNYVENFTGPNVMAVHTMLINKPPDAGTKSSRHPLHQDLHYFPFRPANRIVCAWTALEKVSRENGCLVAIPGSHKGTLLEHDYPDWEGPINMAYHGAKGMGADVERVHVEMGAGDTIFFHPLLIHGSGANRTTGYRKAISCHYASSECNYIDVRGTSQDNIAQEVLQMAKKSYGLELDDYWVVWKFRARLVRGNQVNL
ncbi:Phytanoyl-CoA dioxygenase, peroxisomal [Halotydeus destructor]|nr:Phytanoyl-CoA dioxygenase, peroxisomal [Halotydeus destructor]